jgi:hypothetical protein
VISTLEALPGAIVDAGLQPPALFVIGPTVRHAKALDWRADLLLLGQRVLMASTQEKLASVLEREGADIVLMPTPATPAARVVLSAVPLTGCLVSSRAEVEWLDEERDNPGWGPAVVAWCIGREAAERARECGWRRVVELEDDLDCAELVRRMAVPHAQ